MIDREHDLPITKQAKVLRISPSYSRKAARSRGPRRDFARAAWPVDRVE
jgi:hypothetical protein